VRLLREGIWDLNVEVLEEPGGGGGGFEYFGFVMSKLKTNDTVEIGAVTPGP